MIVLDSAQHMLDVIGHRPVAKIQVNGADAHPLYRYLKRSLPGILGLEAIKWNFTKFLVGKNGIPIKRYAPNDKPGSLEADVEMALP